MKGPIDLINFEDNWTTNAGLSFPGERVVYRNRDLFYDFKDQGWMGLLLYGITNRLFNPKQVRLFEGLWKLSSSYPDPRLWNNRVVSLSGTTRSTAALGIGAAIAISEATIYGRRPDIKSMDFLLRTMSKLDGGQTIDEIVFQELKVYRGIPGYGRPIVNRDERIKPIMDLATDLGFDTGKYVKLALCVEEVLLKSRRRLRMNVAVLDAALAADQGLSRREYYYYTILCFSAGMIPCYIDSIEKTEGTFLPLSCNRLKYIGKYRRKWA